VENVGKRNIMTPLIDSPTDISTSVYGLPLSPIISTWPIHKDDHGSYFVPFAPARHFKSPEKGFVGVEFRFYVDLAKTEPDPLKRKGHCFLRAGVALKDAKPVETTLSDAA